MPDADALLAAVLADPDADLPRLVFADHLDDAGDAVRAEFVRVQCAVAHDPASLSLRAREQTLLALHAADWLRPLRAKGEPLQNPGTHGRFVRGFVEEVWMPAGVFLLRADKLFRRLPVRTLLVTRAGARADRAGLVRCPHLGRLRRLGLPGPHGDEWALRLLTEASAAGLPPAVDLRNSSLSDAGAGHLSLIEAGWRPAELDVRLNPLTDAGLGVLQERFGAAVRL